MLYIVSQNRKKLTDLKTISIVDPGHGREDDEFYRVYVNGAEFGRYRNREAIARIMDEIKRFIHTSQNAYYELPQDV